MSAPSADAATAPRVLLVEDDPSIRRFVRYALEELALELVDAPTLAAARTAIGAAPVCLVLCDLMLPDGSGVDLLQELAAARAAAPTPRLVAFSAGLSAERRDQLEAIGVDEMLAKPVALGELEACVRRALASGVAAAGAPAAPAVAGNPAAAADTIDEADQRAIARYFCGDAALFAAFRAACLPQFARDLAAGDAALAAGNLGALRRLAHSLKSVLLTLGHDVHSARAAAIERAAAAGDAAGAAADWAALRTALRSLAEAG